MTREELISQMKDLLQNTRELYGTVMRFCVQDEKNIPRQWLIFEQLRYLGYSKDALERWLDLAEADEYETRT